VILTPLHTEFIEPLTVGALEPLTNSSAALRYSQPQGPRPRSAVIKVVYVFTCDPLHRLAQIGNPRLESRPVITQVTDLGQTVGKEGLDQIEGFALDIGESGRQILLGYVTVHLPQLDPIVLTFYQYFFTRRQRFRLTDLPRIHLSSIANAGDDECR